MTFEPTLESVRRHEVPDWYHNAKLGIFIHWGLYSVPAWAPAGGDIGEVFESGDMSDWFRVNSYAEWYLNSLKFDDGPTRAWHNKHYGAGFHYDDFKAGFNSALRRWNPSDMATLFREVNARYVVLTSKHHDGFTLWPSDIPCPRKSGYHTQRDVVGELTDAVRAEGLRMAIYYSGGLDWAFNEQRIEQVHDVWGTIVQTPEFVDYSVAHWKELIDKYKPSIMWNDIGYPAAADLGELFAYYYNSVPDGVINDRFTQSRDRAPTAGEPLSVPRGPHYDYVTPEYATFDEIQDGKWECCRGIGHSFGYNRAEGDAELLAEDEMIHMFVDIVSKNGNLLLNVGPMADGAIPDNQADRLRALGRWLDRNGEAIFDTRPWQRAEGKTSQGLDLRFTATEDTLYATLLGRPAESEIRIEQLEAPAGASLQLLGRDADLTWEQDGADLKIQLPDLPDAPAHSIAIRGMGG
ncbi:MAG: alpha-L-fucosidase [Chloroflexota bacterium]|nr:alpha-L-fucosidase [Chloroflexota bacterium]MDE2947178.1 alpha-L-fucosidase [Chloroflexota bacterium]